MTLLLACRQAVARLSHRGAQNRVAGTTPSGAPGYRLPRRPIRAALVSVLASGAILFQSTGPAIPASGVPPLGSDRDRSAMVLADPSPSADPSASLDPSPSADPSASLDPSPSADPSATTAPTTTLPPNGKIKPPGAEAPIAAGSAIAPGGLSAPAVTGDGLLAQYYPNQTWSGAASLVNIDPTVDFDWGGGHPIASGDFSVAWSGSLQIDTPGLYTFGLNSDDGSVLRLNDVVVVDNDGAHPPRLITNTAQLEAGSYPLSLVYFECCGGPALVHFLWTPPGGSGLVVVPQNVLSSETGPPLPPDAIQHLGPGTNPNQNDPSVDAADPVNTFSGNFTNQAIDLAIPGRGLSFALVRTYNSLSTADGPLGPGWTHAYTAKLTPNADGTAFFASEDGARIPFASDGAGGYKPGQGVLSTLSAVAGGYVITRRDQFQYRFDSAGTLTSEVDRNGNTLTFDYTNGDLTSVIDPVGRTVTLGYNASHRLASLVDVIGRTVGYSYDLNGRLSTVTDVRHGVVTYGYDAAGRLATITDANHHTLVTNTYGPDGRVASQLDGRGKRTTFAWDQGTQTATVTDPRGGVTIDVYSGAALVSRRNGAGDLDRFGYDLRYNLVSVTDGRGNTTFMTYDGRGNLLSVTAPQPLAYVQRSTYDTQNNLRTYRDGQGHTTTYDYDSAGNMTTITYADGAVRTFTWDPAGTGLLIAVTDQRLKTTSLAYDSHGDVIRITTPLGEITTMTFDPAGRVMTSVDPRGNVPGADPALYTTTYTHDEADRVTATSDPLGHVTSSTFDPAGNLTSTTDADNHTTSYGLDSGNHLTSVTDAASKTTSYTYDDAGNLKTRTDPLTHTTSWEYDLANRATSETDPLGDVWTIGYDAAGNPTTRTDANGNTTIVTYDELNRLRVVVYAQPSTPVAQFSYDANGNRTSMTDGGAASSGWDPDTGSEIYGYDALDRLMTVSRGTGQSVYTYDAAGNVLTRFYPAPNPAPNNPGVTMTYTYDDDGRMATATADTHTPVDYDQTPPSAPTALTATPSGSGRIDLAWTASVDESGVQGYKIYRDGAYLTTIGPVGSTTLADTGLLAGRTYTYKVSAIDGRSNESAQSSAAVATTVGADTLAPSVPGGVVVTATAWNSVAVSWTASTDNVGVTRYTILRGGAVVAVVAGAVTSFTDRAVTASTLYSYTVKASDAAAKISAASVAKTVTTPVCTCSPITLHPTSDVSNLAFTPNSGTTRYSRLAETTSDGDTTYIQGGTSGTSNAVFGMSGPAGTAFAVTIHYIARATTSGTMNVHAELWNAAALLKTGATHNLGTAYAAFTDTFGLLNFPAANLRVKIVQTSLSSATITSRFTQLDAVATYFPADVIAPTVPSGLTATAVGTTRVDLAWAASTDAVGVQGYKVYRNGVYLSAIGIVGSTSISDTGLTANTAYTYKVSAIDGAAKESAQSTSATATTAGPDIQAPTTPMGVTATSTIWSTATVTWTKSTDNVEVTRYAIFRNGIALAVVAGTVTSFTDRSTFGGNLYSYTVKASDAAGKTSALSTAGSVTPPAAPTTVTTTYTYDAASHLLTQATPDGITAKYSYDRAGRLIEVANVGFLGTLSRSTYALDPAGNPTVVTTNRGSEYLAYDAVNRLTGVCYATSCAGGQVAQACIGCVGSPMSTPAATVTPDPLDVFTNWTYDAVGNRLTEATYQGTSTYVYDNADRLTSRTSPVGAPAITYAYDNNGNQTRAGTNTFAYDLADRLSSATVGSSTQTYVYAGDGVRLAALSGFGDGSQFIVDRNYSLPQVVADRTWSGGGFGGRTFTYGLSRISEIPRGYSADYDHYDGLGSVTDVMSGAGASRSWTVYQPFGAVRTASANGQEAYDPFGFAGEYRDVATELQFLRARMYDPTTGRFLSRDPAAGMLAAPYVSSYAYALNNPLRWIDPSGRNSQSPWSFNPWPALALVGVLVVVGACVVGVCEAIAAAAVAVTESCVALCNRLRDWAAEAEDAAGSGGAALPRKVQEVLKTIDETGEAPSGYQGGRPFLNDGRGGGEILPNGEGQTYQEWDVNPNQPGVNRGPERLVTGSDGSAYYTDSHYTTFTRIR